MTVISGPYDPNGSDEQGRLSLDGKRYSHLLQVGMLKALYYWYSLVLLVFTIKFTIDIDYDSTGVHNKVHNWYSLWFYWCSQ